MKAIKGLLYMGFQRSRNISKEINWSSSSFLIVGSFDRKGNSMWLNKGSKICIRWATQASTLHKTQVIMIKGETGQETLVPKRTFPIDSLFLNEQVTGKEAEFTVDEDDKYFVGAINSNPRSIIMAFTINVISKVYDVTKARSMCSTLNGPCRLDLQFPNTRYVVVSTTDNGDVNGWYVEVSFVARFVSYIDILGFFITIILLVLKSLRACDSEATAFDLKISWRTETEPILLGKSAQKYKLCVICYDDEHNCFFIPCGHCATWYDCAQRTMEEDNKMCPICRRLIHKVRRLFIGANM